MSEKSRKREPCWLRLPSELSNLPSANQKNVSGRISFLRFSSLDVFILNSQSSLFFWTVETWTTVSLVIIFLLKRKKFLKKKVTHREFVVFLWNFINAWKVARGKFAWKISNRIKSDIEFVTKTWITSSIFLRSVGINLYKKKFWRKNKKRVGKIFPLEQEEK